MIATVNIELNAERPWLPLAEFSAFVNSPSQVRVTGVPSAIGNWRLTKLYAAVAYPDNTLHTIELSPGGVVPESQPQSTGDTGGGSRLCQGSGVQAGASPQLQNSPVSPALCGQTTPLTATLPASAAVGSNPKGFQILADGIDEAGNIVTGYCLGAGPVRIMPRDGIIVVGDTRYYFHYLDAQPVTPKKGDACVVDGVLKWYNGTAWQPFAGIPVVDPSTNPADAGKAADAYATGTALADKADASALAAKRDLGDLSVRGAPYFDASYNEVGSIYLDGVKVDPVGGDPKWSTENEEINLVSAGSYSFADFSDPEDVKVEYFTLTAANNYTATVLGHVIVGVVDEIAKTSQLPSVPAISTNIASDATSDTKTASPKAVKTYVDATTDGKTALTPIYGGDGNRFTTWTILRDGVDITADVSQPEWMTTEFDPEGFWNPTGCLFSGDTNLASEVTNDHDHDATVMTWQAVDYEENLHDYTATRTENPVVGYTLGSQSTKPLQPKGDYQPALSAQQLANIAAVPNKADATALRYDLPANATVISSASSEVVEGETVYYGAATLADRTANVVQVTAATALDELRITFPAATSGKVRDFGLRVEVGTGSAALTAPALVPIAPTGETVTLENSDSAIPAIADGTADAKGVTLLYFSETAPGVFLVKGEQVQEVA